MLLMTAAGRVGKNAETRFAQDGTALTSFSLAIDQGKDKQGNDRAPVWVSCTLRGERGQKVAKYITKGMALAVDGRPQATVWTAQDGTAKPELKMWVDKFTFLGGGQKQEDAPKDDGGNGGGWQPPSDLDDEIPFE